MRQLKKILMYNKCKKRKIIRLLVLKKEGFLMKIWIKIWNKKPLRKKYALVILCLTFIRNDKKIVQIIKNYYFILSNIFFLV